MTKRVNAKLRILVTGASGFVGTHLVDLLHKEYQVIPFGRNPDLSTPKGIIGDLTNLKDITKACDSVDGVIHLAALTRVKTTSKQPWDCMNINVMGTANMLEAVRYSRKKPWLIMGSTCAVDTLDSLYGMSKFMGEYLCAHYARVFNVRSLVLRFSDIYGSTKDNADKMIPKITRQALAGEGISVHGGDQVFDLIYYEDIIQGIKMAVKYMQKTQKGTNFEVISLCTGRLTSLIELVNIIVRKTGSPSKVERLLTNASVKMPKMVSSCQKAKSRLGFRARIDFSRGIERYLRLAGTGAHVKKYGCGGVL